MPGNPMFITSATLTALDVAVNQRTPVPGDDGAFLCGSAMPSASGKYVLVYDNEAGSGRPLFAYQARQAVPVQASMPDLPAPVNDIYRQNGTSDTGHFVAVIPTGSNNPAGIRRVEARNADFSLYAFNTDDDGIWPSGANTTVPVRREVVSLTTSDAPLEPCAPLPPVSGFWADDTLIFTGDTVNFFDASLYCPGTWNWSFVGGIPMSSASRNPEGIVFNYPGDFNICLTTTNGNGYHLLCRHGYIRVTEPVIPAIVITEIMYNPPESGTDSLEFIELMNNDTVTVNLLDFSFASGVNFTFPDIDLAPGERIVVCKNDSAYQRTFGAAALKWTSGSLTNSGELILLQDAYGHTVDSVEYGDSAPWDPLCNGGGPSLELCDPGCDNSLGRNWRAAPEFAAVNAEGDTLWSSPGTGCLFAPVADFISSDRTIIAGGEVSFTSLSTGDPFLFEWTFPGGEPGTWPGETPPPVRYEEPGSYDVSLLVANAVGEDMILREECIEVIPLTGVNEREGGVTVFPNPAEGGRFSLRIPASGRYGVWIYSSGGRLLATTEARGGKGEVTFAGIPAGLCLVLVRNLENAATFTGKIVIR
jgi:PKD repeat protein